MATAGGPSSTDDDDFFRRLRDELPALTKRVAEENARLLEEERKKKELELGLIGRVIGESTPGGRFATFGFAIISFLLFLALCGVIFSAKSDQSLEVLKFTIGGLIAVLTALAGYMFGQQSHPPSKGSGHS